MTTIIAEAGSNHNGKVELAIKLAAVAHRSGADYCKYQFIRPAGLYLPVELDEGGHVAGNSDCAPPSAPRHKLPLGEAHIECSRIDRGMGSGRQDPVFARVHR